MLAAVLRLPGLEVRGAFDADQGHDMLVLAGILRGDIPLLGPPASTGTFHHGAVYYYALAPAVLLFGPDPVAVTGWIAVWGIAAVAATWWLGRLLGGPIAAFVAGLLLAISPAGIDSSTFIWNPNLIPCAAALAFAAAIHAWRARSPRWWLLVAAGAMVTMQAHVLGLVVLPPLVVAYLADLRRAGREQRRREVGLAGIGAVAIVGLSYVPLAIHELQTNFAELRAIAAYAAGDGRGAASSLLDRLSIVAMRSVVWPFAGLVSAEPVRSLGALLLVVISAVIAVARGRRTERRAVGFVLASIGWSVLALSVAAPSLAVIVPGLPNDHYHAFLDPLLVAVVAAGIARLAGSGLPARDGRPSHMATGPRRRCAARRLRHHRGERMAARGVARRRLAGRGAGRGDDRVACRGRAVCAGRHPTVQDHERGALPARAAGRNPSGAGRRHARRCGSRRVRLRPAVRGGRRRTMRRPGGIGMAGRSRADTGAARSGAGRGPSGDHELGGGLTATLGHSSA